MSRSRANSRTVTRMRPAPPPRAPLIVGIGGRALDPDVAAVEEFVLPDRRDLLDALDRVAARGERVAAMRRRGGDRHARFADLEPADPMVQREPRARPSLADLAAIRSNAFSASGSYASYSRYRTRRPRLWLRTRPRNVDHRAVDAVRLAGEPRSAARARAAPGRWRAAAASPFQYTAARNDRADRAPWPMPAPCPDRARRRIAARAATASRSVVAERQVVPRPPRRTCSRCRACCGVVDSRACGTRETRARRTADRRRSTSIRSASALAARDDDRRGAQS